MRIDVQPKYTNASQHYLIQGGKYVHPYTGLMYCFCYSDGIAATVGDPYRQTKTSYDWVNEAVSVLWTPEQMAEFRPNDTVNEVLNWLLDSHGTELCNYQQLHKESLAKAKRMKRDYEGYGDTNLTELYLNRLTFLKENTIVFLEINFDK